MTSDTLVPSSWALAGAIGVIVELTSMRRLPTGTFLVTARGECKCRIAECWREEGTEGG